MENYSKTFKIPKGIIGFTEEDEIELENFYNELDLKQDFDADIEILLSKFSLDNNAEEELQHLIIKLIQKYNIINKKIKIKKDYLIDDELKNTANQISKIIINEYIRKTILIPIIVKNKLKKLNLSPKYHIPRAAEANDFAKKIIRNFLIYSLHKNINPLTSKGEQHLINYINNMLKVKENKVNISKEHFKKKNERNKGNPLSR